ncbi:MAG: hypothetical protein HBSAPP02_03650 [Phycisphaerae bacterium]|nr:MAG: PQQ-binding-like beta-propeller repeat protein [Planctomycetia bacterium]RIK66496.1 MAG: serine/threonine protein kinase [Planctomycetota bacterium]GJQ25333.1 MAG: hypothetical protein HBSAPP02_03650 [Phycisphaerae bacterium]
MTTITTLVWMTAAVLGPSDWPSFRGNERLTGVATSTVPDKPALRWKFSAGEPIGSSAAIVDGVVYVGCDNGTLYALKLSDGGVVWAAKTPASRTTSGPASTSQAIPPTIQSSPAVCGDLVLYGDEDGGFHALNRADGTRRWSFRSEAENISSPICSGDRVVFGSYDGNVYCLKLTDGSLLWKHLTDGRVHGSAGVSDGKVVVAGCDQKLHVLQLSDGKSIAAVDLGSVSGCSAAIVDDAVYVGTFGNDVLAIDLKRNERRWTFTNKDRDFPFYASAAVTEELVIIGSRDKFVHALDRKTGKPRWQFRTRGRVDSSPVVAADRVWVGSSDGNVYGLDLRSGEERWRYEAGSPVTASPAVGGGCLVIGTEDGDILCFGEGPGRPPSRN